jgi:hypothetical protein
MTFEEQLTRAFETLTERLRGEIDQHVQRASAELVATRPYDRDPAVIEAARQELEAAVEAARQDAHERGLAAGREAASAEAREELARAVAVAQQEAHDAGLTAGREVASAQAREELAHAVAVAQQEAHDAGLTAGREAASAQAREELAHAVAVARQEAHDAGLIAGRDAERTEALEKVPPPVITKAVFEPRLIDAMRSIERARSLTEVLDALLSGASADVSGAGVWLVRGGGLHQWRAPEPVGGAAAEPVKSLDEDSATAQAARTNAIASADGTVAVPIAMSGVVVAVLVADLDASGSNDERRTTNLELLTAYAARSLEALTAFKTARALTQRPEPAAVGAAPVVVDEAGAEEDTSARRYARLLVSEIKLYHESAVVEGRRDRDLATRLGGEIARARVMYEQRVPPHVRARADYFQTELIRTLADGDATLLELRT